MANKKRKVNLALVLLIIAVIAMTIGFAQYTAKLNINGTVNVKKASWSVHYVENDITESTGSVKADTTKTSVSKTDYKFTVTLEKPGDFYEATVKITNDGTLDAKLTDLTMGGLSAENQKYLTYTVTYDGTDYTASQTGLNLELKAGETKNVKVRVAYILPTNSADLPSEDTTVTVTGSFDYVDK